MSFGTSLYTFLYGNLVGKDSGENKYYCNSKNFKDPDSKRWVIFNGAIEATKIPPHWHSWLHKSIDEPPIDYSHNFSWQKKHQENMTGTDKAYFPNSHPLSNSYKNREIKSDYEPWKP